MSYDSSNRRYLKQEYFYKSNIIRYRPGWSKEAIEKFLGEADKKKNDRYKRDGVKRCLYLRESVFNVESTEEFKKFAIENIHRGRSRRLLGS